MGVKNICVAMLCATTMYGCGQGEKSSNIQGASKEEIKAVSEYRDSGKWGKAVRRLYDAGEFDAFQAEGHMDVVFRQADECSVKTIGHAEAIEQYEIRVENKKTLVVGLKENANERYDNIPAITLLITAPTLRCAMVSGGDVEMKGELVQDDSLTVYVRGDGDVYAKHIRAGALDIEISGNGDVDIRKATIKGNVRATVNGDGGIEGKLKCDNAFIEVNGSGSVDMDVKCNDLTAWCNGRGEIELKGKCRTLRKRKGAGGRIDSHNLTVEKEILLDK